MDIPFGNISTVVGHLRCNSLNTTASRTHSGDGPGGHVAGKRVVGTTVWAGDNTPAFFISLSLSAQDRQRTNLQARPSLT